MSKLLPFGEFMKTSLILFCLSIQSSYSENLEIPATQAAFDTVQFYRANGMNWRVKIYAKDQDVHICSLDPDIIDLITLARADTETYYGDVVREGYIIETEEGLKGIKRGLREWGFSSSLALFTSGALFWVPEASHYRTQSEPQ